MSHRERGNLIVDLVNQQFHVVDHDLGLAGFVADVPDPRLMLLDASLSGLRTFAEDLAGLAQFREVSVALGNESLNLGRVLGIDLGLTEPELGKPRFRLRDDLGRGTLGTLVVVVVHHGVHYTTRGLGAQGDF